MAKTDENLLKRSSETTLDSDKSVLDDEFVFLTVPKCVKKVIIQKGDKKLLWKFKIKMYKLYCKLNKKIKQLLYITCI